MFCSKCGNTLNEDDLYCKVCGAQQNILPSQPTQHQNSVQNLHAASNTQVWKITAAALGIILILLSVSAVILKVFPLNTSSKKSADKETTVVSSTSNQEKPKIDIGQDTSTQPLKPRSFQGIPESNSNPDPASAPPPSPANSTQAPTVDNAYILPDSDTRHLKEADLFGLTKADLRLARNEIYARRGRMFKAQDLQDYFNSKDWYIPSIVPEDFKETYLTEVEKYNAQFIKQYEDQ